LRREKAMGFDLLEMGVENPDEWDPARVAEILAANDLGALVCAVMGEGRDLLQRDLIASTQDYIRTCIDTAVTVGSSVVAGPFYAPTDKTWRMENVERAASIDRLVEGLRPLATTRASVVSASPSNRSIASRRASSAPQCRRWRSSTASIPQRSGCCRTPFI
jgi:D-psicose/D-tagatose/L-ribulose 3-epimerase